jgi:UrcA family protein
MNRMTLAIAFGCFALSLSAHAQSSSGPVKTTSMSVTYADLDIRHEAGARVLLGRLKQAASQVCAPAPERELSDVDQFESCYKAALDSAVSRVSSAAVSRVYAGGSVDAETASAR